MGKRNILQSDSLCYFLCHFDFFSDAIDEMEPALGKEYGERYAGKSSSRSYVEKRCFGCELYHFGYTEGMQYVMGVKVIDIFTRNHVDFGIPVVIQPL